MAARKAANEQPVTPAVGDVIDATVLARAEERGGFRGKMQAKAEGWLESEAVQQQLGQIRDGAADLLEHVTRAGAVVREAAAKSASAAKKSAPPAAAAPARASRGAVDAPGKRHRKPPPQQRIDKRMGEAVGKHMGQKSFQVGKSRGRG